MKLEKDKVRTIEFFGGLMTLVDTAAEQMYEKIREDCVTFGELQEKLEVLLNDAVWGCKKKPEREIYIRKLIAMAEKEIANLEIKRPVGEASETEASQRYSKAEKEAMVEELMQEIENVNKDLFYKDSLQRVRGCIEMAFNLDAISLDGYERLDDICFARLYPELNSKVSE